MPGVGALLGVQGAIVVEAGGGGGGITVTELIDTKIADTTGPLSVTTASFTPADGCLLVIGVCATVRANNMDPANSSCTISGLSPTQRTAQSNDTGFLGFSYSSVLEIWTAPVTTGASVTLTFANTVTSFLADGVVAIKVLQVTGQNASPIGAVIDSSNNANFASGDGAGSLTLPSSPASSSMVIGFRFFESDAGTDTNATPGATFTEISDNKALASYAGAACLQAEKRTGSTSTTVDWTDVNVEGGAVFSCAAAAIEIVSA